jgi:NDP-sugar pyrophosphorylase family protein
MHSVMILAAGLGSRLLPLTEERPKALVPVGDRPLLSALAERLRAAGYRSAIINTHHRADDFRSVLQDLPIKIEESFEPEILGTAGGIANVRGRLSAPVVIHNADIDCQLDFAELAQRAALGGLCLACVRRSKGQGVVGVDTTGAVVRLRGETFAEEVHGADYIGVAALGADCLAELPTPGCLIGDYCLPRLRAGGRVDALCQSVQWNDIGSLPTYVEANFKWLASWQRRAPSPRSDASYVGVNASIGPQVNLVGCIVGARARVAGAGVIERCIVWPDAVATAPLRDVIVTRSGRVIPFPVA